MSEQARQVHAASVDCVPGSGCVDWRTRVRRLREALVAAQWGDRQADAKDYRAYCPVCHESWDRGHVGDCLIGAALAEAAEPHAGEQVDGYAALEAELEAERNRARRLQTLVDAYDAFADWYTGGELPPETWEGTFAPRIRAALLARVPVEPDLREQVRRLTSERDEAREDYQAAERIVALEDQVRRLREALEGEAQIVHQAYHQDLDETWRECPRGVCANVRAVLAEVAEPGAPAPESGYREALESLLTLLHNENCGCVLDLAPFKVLDRRARELLGWPARAVEPGGKEE